MELYYLWNDRMSDIDYEQEEDPEEYFYKLIYEEKDKWSWITDDYASLEASYDGEPVEMGYSPSFYLMSDNESVYIVVDYVYEGSPADEAGIERGDIILSIDNTELNTSNYYDLYSQDAYSVQLAEINNNIISYTGESINLVARVVETNPVLYHDVIDLEGHKVGYLVYAEFITGKDDKFLTTLDEVFSEFQTEGISDLVVDLRYNPGGDIDAAVYLASAIAPTETASGEDVLISLQYNDNLQSYFEYNLNEYEDNLYYYFRSDVVNINMKRVYFLTSSGTASSSELVMSGLMPYMDVTLIGEDTYGKCYGAWVMPDDNEEWAIIPIVMKYANADGYTDFITGIPVDDEVEPDYLSSTPFGDLSDAALAKALSLATGVELTTESSLKSASLNLTKLTTPKLEKKRNLIISEHSGLMDAN